MWLSMALCGCLWFYAAACDCVCLCVALWSCVRLARLCVTACGLDFLFWMKVHDVWLCIFNCGFVWLNVVIFG